MNDLEELVITGKVEGMNTSDSILNLIVNDIDGNTHNLKYDPAKGLNIAMNCIYKFKVVKNPQSERNTAFVMEALSPDDIEDVKEKNKIYRAFMAASPVTYDELESKVNSYLNKIDNKILFDITKNIINKYHDDFFLYPAATKLHQAYIGGLAYHTLGMLELADGFLKNYSFLNKDYLYSGIILHDMGKVIEFSGIENTIYALKGHLLGHLVIEAMEIDNVAKELGYSEKEEVLYLEHMIISHHGQPQFGACKKPITSEALMLWYIDIIDSKFRTLGEQLEITLDDSFTEPIGVLDRTKIYKHK